MPLLQRQTFPRHAMSSNLSVDVDEDGAAVLITAYASTETVTKMVTEEERYFVETEFKAVTVDDPDVYQFQLHSPTSLKSCLRKL